MLEFTKKTNGASVAFMASGAIWFLLGTLYGLIDATHLVAPEFFNNISWLVFSRVRPIHVNSVVFGFVASTLLGCALYIAPALLRTRLWSERLGWTSFVFWQLAVLSGPVLLPLGITQGREYAEYIWIFDLCVMAALLTLIINLVMTVTTRTENILYVSVWYFLGAALWTAGVYPIGNVMWHPATGAMPGLIDSVLLWFYGHNLVGLLLTPLALGAAYFVIPRIARAPVYSHTLSLVGFWVLVGLYTHIGGHHILQAPIPNWLKTISTVDSIAMILPVTIVVLNLLMTGRGREGKIWNDAGGRAVLAGVLWYIIVCIQGPLQSLPSLQKVTHFTNWTIGHAHIAVLGFSGFIALGTLWHVFPLATGRRLYSPRLANLQFALVTMGLIGFFAVLTTAGLIQGFAWYRGVALYNVLPELTVFMALRLAFGFFIVAGAVLGVVNVFATLRRGEKFHPEPLTEEPQL